MKRKVTIDKDRVKKFEVTADLKKKLSKLAKGVGVKLNWKRNPSFSFQWDGTDIACDGQNASNILHDIAHWVFADEDRKEVEDFGLGPGPDSGFSDTIMMVTGEESGNEEELASALGIWWEKQLGLPWEETKEYHNWGNGQVPRRMQAATLEDFWAYKVAKQIKQYEIFL